MLGQFCLFFLFLLFFFVFRYFVIFISFWYLRIKLTDKKNLQQKTFHHFQIHFIEIIREKLLGDETKTHTYTNDIEQEFRKKSPQSFNLLA